jgi:hypothetical protein
MPGKENCKST